MTTKLTLTVDDKVINAAKEYARSQQKSLSQIVENYLKSLTKSSTTERVKIHPELAKMRGVVDWGKDFDYKKELAKAIEEKYKL